MIRSYSYRLRPTRAQRTALVRTLEAHRNLYNSALQERRDAYRMSKIRVTYKMQSAQLKPIRQILPEMAALNFTSCQQTLRRLDRAFQSFFRRVLEGKKEVDYPRFKGRHRFDSVCYVYGDGIKLHNELLYIGGIGRVRISLHRDIGQATIKMIIVKRDSIGNWYAVLQIEQPDPIPLAHSPLVVGIDMGLEKFATLSTGRFIKNPRFFRLDAKSLAKAQINRDTLPRNSVDRRKASRRVQHIHARIANRRKDFAHKLSRALANTFQVIVFEDLNTKGMMQNHHLAKSIGDASWNQLIQYTTYKAAEAGRSCVLVSPKYTSQDCSQCGERVRKGLKSRVHICPSCGLEMDRDLNAALNVLARGLAYIGINP